MVSNADVAGDGYTMVSPAPFIIDPLDPSQILLGTCRMWRGPVDGTRWTSANGISPFLDGVANHTYCSGDALIRSISALPLAGGGEVIFVGMFGSLNGGATLGGHILSAVLVPGSSSQPEWRDLTLNPVANSQVSFNHYALDISSIFIDPHDPSGNTVYVTVAGVPDFYHAICTVYRTADGGSHWYEINSNVRTSPANSIVIDPQDANTAYLATDAGVYSTRQVSTCINGPSNCWSVFGAGLPYAPVTQLTASAGPPAPAVLVAATYGRGSWQIPLWTAGTELTAASFNSSSLTFAAQTVGTASPAQTITLTNDGGIALAITSIVVDPPFSENDNCIGNALNEGAACTIQVIFAPDRVGAAPGELTLFANVPEGRMTVALAGTGSLSGPIRVSPGILDFGQVAIGSTSASMSVTVENATSSDLSLTSVSDSGPFRIAGNP